MYFIKYLPLTILLFFTLKFLISYIDKSTTSLNTKLIEKQIETGMLSIKDIQKDKYSEFIKIINLYFEILGINESVILPNGSSELTNFTGLLNNEPIFISCIQNDFHGKTSKDEDNWDKTSIPDIQSFLARTFMYDCKKGILITNSTFSNEAIEFADNFNGKNTGMEIKLITGYELTKSIRNHKSYIMKEGLMNEVKYNI